MDTTTISERFHLRIKDEIAHRNANSRIDSFVDLLIKSVEDMFDSIDIIDCRRLVNSAYPITETHKRHKTDVDLFSSQPTNEVIVVWDGYYECNLDLRKYF